MAEQYTNIRLILDKALRHPLMHDLSFETAVDYTIDFMRIVGVPTLFEEKVVELKVDNYRAKLPCDYYQIIQIRNKNGITLKHSSDTFHMKNEECKGFSYKIQGNIIYTSIESDTVELSYEAIAVDDEGYPLIPDNSSFTRALIAYIKKQWFTILFDLGKIHQAILQHAEQEYAWAVGDCQTEFNRLTLDKAESFYNSWRELIIRDHSYRNNFRTNNIK